ncbi:MAG: Lrp/AsnC family transcriptional regulator [Nitrososphaerota archaeon]|nr:Lrp/AsnC family transcriptional regulator [Aigarchaeota archaeon]MDW8076333.1 Lrp/AsnC family transcriptional regulator [Nitrososphaerota archaeon]
MMDERDWKILNALIEDASQSISDLAIKLGMPRTTIQERIKKLRSKGIIKKFTVIPDYSKLGKPATAFVLISFLPGTSISQKKLGEYIATLPDVYEVHLISGEWDILLKVRGESIQAIGELVIDKLRTIEGVGKSMTCASFLTIKEEF